MMDSLKEKSITLYSYTTVEDIHEMVEYSYKELKRLYGKLMPDKPMIKPIDVDIQEREFKKQFNELIQKIIEHNRKMQVIYFEEQRRAVREFYPIM